MQQISPSTSLRLVYLIQDHTDSNTYYVRSVVRDSVSGNILATIDLTDTGNRRFYGTYNTPATEDTFIDVTTTVYSDSGYTTKAQDKYEEIQQYLVRTQWGLQFGSGGDIRLGGKSASVDYKKIRDIVKEEMVKPYDDSSLKVALSEIYTCVEYIKNNQYDDKSVLEKLSTLSKLVRAIDLSLIVSKIDSIEKIDYSRMPKDVDYDRILKMITENDAEESSVKEDVDEEDNSKREEKGKKTLRVIGGLYRPVNVRVKNLI